MVRPRLLIAIGMAVIFTILATDGRHALGGQVIHVELEADSVQVEGLCSLREAVTAANFDTDSNGDCEQASGADTIEVPDGTYPLNLGEMVVMEDLDIIGDGALSTTVDANGTSRIFTVDDGVTMTLAQIALREGLADDAALFGEFGGAILNHGALTTNGVTFTLNKSLDEGGAIMTDGPSLTVMDGNFQDSEVLAGVNHVGGAISARNEVTITDSMFDGNEADFQGMGGGGAFGGGVYHREGTLTIADSSFTNNLSFNGGAIYAADTADLSRVSVIGNVAENNAGGIGVGPVATVTIRNSVIQENVAYGNGGSGIFNSGDLSIFDTAIINNGDALSTRGGGIRSDDNQAESGLRVERSLIAGNQSREIGGGLDIEGNATIINTTISGNMAAAAGAIHHNVTLFLDGHDTTSLLNVTVAENSAADNTDGIYAVAGTVEMLNTIVDNGVGTMSCSGAGTFLSLGHNIENGDSCPFTAGGDQQDTDPLLGILQGNGGETETHALAPGSPALGTADAAECPDEDQRFQPRPQGNGCDVGAFESAFTNATASPSPTPSNAPTPTEPPPQNPTQGDVDCDGDVDIDDFNLLIQFAAALSDGVTPAPCLNLGDPELNSGFPWADVNCDGNVDALDALFVLAHIAGIELDQPEGCFPIGQVMT